MNPRRNYKLWSSTNEASGLCKHCGRTAPSDGNKHCESCLSTWRSYWRRKNSGETADNHIGASFAEIGIALGVSRQRAEQVFKFAMMKMSVALDSFGIDTGDMSVESVVKVALARQSDWRMAHWSEFLATAIKRNAAKASA